MKLTTKQLRQIIKEEVSQLLNENENYTEHLGDLFSRDAEDIIMALEMAYSLGLTPEELPFERLDLSKQNIPNYADLLRVAEVVLDTYGDYIVSYLRRHLIKAMEKGLRRRLEMGMTTGMENAASKIRNIIKNELTAHQRKINKWNPIT